MKILFIGLGSAGQRHLRNIKRILGSNAEFLAYRVRKLDRVFNESLQVVPDKELNSEYGIRVFGDLSEALAEKPDIAVIANPNSMHIECALMAAEAGCDLFIEKPLSDSMEGIQSLIETAQRHKLKIFIGFQNRLHPCVRKLKEILDSGKLGQLVSVHCEIGERLTKMHSYEDYRGMNESRKETGGGVVLCQIHELDYLYWMFGYPVELVSIGGRNSHLEIDVEDHVTTLCRYQRKDYEFPVVIQQDFLQFPPTRGCKVVGEYGHAQINLLNNECVVCLEGKEPERIIFEGFARNDMFLEEMRLFLECVETRGTEFINIKDGCGSLRLAMSIKESIESRSSVKL